MGLKKITFDGGSVSAKTDPDLYHFLQSSQLGILKGLKNSVSYTLANNIVTFQDGYISVYGRIIYVEPNTQIAVSPDSNKYGYVILTVNTIDNTVNLSLKENSGTYPNITFNSIIDSDGICEVPLCGYIKTTTSVTLDLNFKPNYVLTDNQLLNDYKTQLRSDTEPRVITPTLVSSGVYRISGTSSSELYRALLVVVVNGTTHVTFASPMLFITVGSTGGVQYQIGGTNYSMNFVYNGGLLTISCGSSSHKISRVIIYKY